MPVSSRGLTTQNRDPVDRLVSAYFAPPLFGSMITTISFLSAQKPHFLKIRTLTLPPPNNSDAHCLRLDALENG